MAQTDDPSELSTTRLGERVVALRQQHNFTLNQLATASGVSRSMLSQIERGQANPTLGVTFRIAKAFDMSIGELVDDPSASSPIEVIHGSDTGNVFRNDDECQIRTLSPLHMEKHVEFYEVKLKPGCELASAPHFEGTRELVTITSGSARLEAAGSESSLQTGDSAHYRADVPHTIANTGRGELRAYLVVTYR